VKRIPPSTRLVPSTARGDVVEACAQRRRRSDADTAGEDDEDVRLRLHACPPFMGIGEESLLRLAASRSVLNTKSEWKTESEEAALFRPGKRTALVARRSRSRRCGNSRLSLIKPLTLSPSFSVEVALTLPPAVSKAVEAGRGLKAASKDDRLRRRRMGAGSSLPDASRS